jgi:hypothetical protein
MKAKLLRNAEESTQGWTPERKAALRFAREEQDEAGNVTGHFACYQRGEIVEGPFAEKCVADGIAEQVTE